MESSHLLWHFEEPCVVVQADVKFDGLDLLPALVLKELGDSMAATACCIHHKLGRQNLSGGQTDACVHTSTLFNLEALRKYYS